MKWLLKASQNMQEQIRDEYGRRYLDASYQEREIRNSYPRKATLYFDSLVEDAQVSRAEQKPWQEMLVWMQSVLPQVQQTGDQQFIDSFNRDLRTIEYKATRQIEEPNPAEYQDWYDPEIVEFYLDTDNLEELLKLLDQHDVVYEVHKAPTGKQVMTIEMGETEGYGGRMYPVNWVVEQDKDGTLHYWKSTDEWIQDVHDEAEEYFGEHSESDEFWQGVGSGAYLYHATSTENVESILSSGLEARDDTRGLSNRDMGPAVFTVTGENSDDIHAALESYGESVIRIDVGAMKADGFMPEVGGETPVNEAKMKGALAHLIGDDTYEADQESDYMDDTIAIYSDIPPKYLSILGS
jgi:hypothetical protein